jgi:hypothetical protein
MIRIGLMAASLMFTLAVSSSRIEAETPWVALDSSGRLVYRTLPRGDRIVDFSYAGYMGGGVPLPSRLPMGMAVAPSGGDDTAAIQKAIDEVSAMPLKEGIRGAVLLKAGTFQCSATPNITASGVILHGSGPTEGGTTLKLTGEPHVAISIAGNHEEKVVGTPAHIVEPYVPSGALTITVDDGSVFAPGDSIRITRETTP